MTETKKSTNTTLQIVLIAGLLVVAFFGAYAFAGARNKSKAAAPVSTVAAPGAVAPAGGAPATDGSGTPACACCGTTAPTEGGVTGEPVEGTAKVADGVQTIDVKVDGTYSPNVIKLKAGVPAEITFGQSSGCTAQVVSVELGISEDLSTGPKVVKLAALKKGTYSFSCGMSMVFGKIVVE
ncbi:MAG: cupredoxin domain-containing protein [Coriobacteriia bacterium]|nr:cupredoxin domain-containing protein [Coriobacteriia bacterium]